MQNDDEEAVPGLFILAVRDIARSARFYSSAFSWKRIVDEPVYVEFLTQNGIRIGFYERKAFSATSRKAVVDSPPGLASGAEIYLYVTNIELMIDRLKNVGAEITSPLERRHWGDEAAYFCDPDGNVIVLARRIESQ